MESKIFCIGRNKTGTTSLKHTLKEHGFTIGNQRQAELLIHKYAKRDFKPIAQYCEKSNFFQDVPFSLPYLYVYLDNYFENAKFILTVRSSPDEWYNSLVNFHSDVFDTQHKLPSKEDLQNAEYIYKGYAWEVNRIIYNTPEHDLYNKKTLIRSYNIHNREVKNYFRHKSNLLVLSLKKSNSYKRLCNFLNLKPIFHKMPHLNKAR